MNSEGGRRYAICILVGRSWMPFRARPAARPSYTVVRTEIVHDKNGVPASVEYIEALRADGSRIYLASGEKILVNESLATKSTYPRSTRGEALVRVPEASCLTDNEKKLGWRVDGSESIGGFRTIRLVYQGPDHTIKSWHAVDVGCATFQQTFEDASGRGVQTLASLTLGEPDPALFHVPATQTN
jgi:hypothetical protein